MLKTILMASQRVKYLFALFLQVQRRHEAARVLFEEVLPFTPKEPPDEDGPSPSSDLDACDSGSLVIHGKSAWRNRDIDARL